MPHNFSRVEPVKCLEREREGGREGGNLRWQRTQQEPLS
jgi:hypothetical protein